MTSRFTVVSIISACTSLLLAGISPADTRVFTNRDGKTIRAELISADETQIQIKTPAGRKFTLKIDQLSDEDQEFVREKIEADKEAAEEEKAKLEKAAAAVRARQAIVDFSNENLGKGVGDGECWTLADRAYQVAKIQRPGGDLRVWGREIDLEEEEALPGDIVEIEKATFKNSDGSTTKIPNQHTSIVAKVGKRGQLEVFEQNIGGNKTVQVNRLEIRALESGSLKIYRYE